MAHPNPDPPFPEDEPGVPGPDVEIPETPDIQQDAPFTGDPHDGRPHDTSPAVFTPPPAD
jgi:hypothetical protein